MIVSVGIIISCKKENGATTDSAKSSTLIKKDNLFEKLTSGKFPIQNTRGGSSISSLSETIQNLNVDAINVNQVTTSRVDFSVQVNGSALLINAADYSLNNVKYTVSRVNNIYLISNSATSTKVKYDFQNNKFYINYNGTDIDIDNMTVIPSDAISSDCIVQLIMLNEFAQENLVAVPASVNRTSVVGTGVGFHLGRKDAEYFCNSDLSKIIAAHKLQGWWSPGTSISCLFGEHYCVCTATFYVGH